MHCALVGVGGASGYPASQRHLAGRYPEESLLRIRIPTMELLSLLGPPSSLITNILQVGENSCFSWAFICEL